MQSAQELCTAVRCIVHAAIGGRPSYCGKVSPSPGPPRTVVFDATVWGRRLIEKCYLIAGAYESV